MRFQDKVAVVTGGANGIGRAVVELFAEEGAQVVIWDLADDAGQTLAAEITSSGGKALYRHVNVTESEDVDAAVEELIAEVGQIDILINNAGNAHGLSTIDKGSLDDWDAMIDINVKGLLYVSRAIIPGMVERKSGHVINIGSIAGKEVYANGNVYCASKFAVDALSTGMRIDLNAHGIKVSEVKPGAVDTEFSEVRFKGDKEKANKVYDGFKPLVAEDIADIIYFISTRPAHVNIADTLVFSTAQATATMVNRYGN